MNQQPTQSAPGRGSSNFRWLLIVFAILLVLGGGYLLYAKFGKGKTTSSTSPSPVVTTSISAAVSPTTSSSVPADWKTYTNSSYKYSVKYPADWQLNDYPQRVAFSESKLLPDTDQMGIVEILILSESKNDAMKEAYDALSGAGAPTIDITTIDGADAVKYSGKPSENVMGGGTHRMIVVFERNGVVYFAEAIDNGNSTIISRFNQMLSSFKFTS